MDMTGIITAIEDGTIKALYVLEDDIAQDPRFAAAIENLQLLIIHSPSGQDCRCG